MKQLVGSLGGSTKITSEVGHGTLCTVVVKVLRPEAESLLPPKATITPSPAELRGLRVGFLGFDSLSREHYKAALSKVTRRNHAIKATLMSAMQNLGLQTRLVASSTSPDVDIFLTTEDSYQEMNRPSLVSCKVPFLVLSSSIQVDYREVSLKQGPVVHLSQPFGPLRLISALNSCMTFCKGTEPISEKTIIVESDHKSRILVQSSIELGGNTVIQSEPVKDKPGAEAKELMPIASDVNDPPSRPKVLLVEDNAINLKVCIYLLTMFYIYSDLIYSASCYIYAQTQMPL